MLEYITIPTAQRPIRIRDDEWCVLYQASNTEGIVTVYRHKKREDKHIVRMHYNGKNAAQVGTNIPDMVRMCGTYCGLDKIKVDRTISLILDVEYA